MRSYGSQGISRLKAASWGASTSHLLKPQLLRCDHRLRGLEVDDGVLQDPTSGTQEGERIPSGQVLGGERRRIIQLQVQLGSVGLNQPGQASHVEGQELHQRKRP